MANMITFEVTTSVFEAVVSEQTGVKSLVIEGKDDAKAAMESVIALNGWGDFVDNGQEFVIHVDRVKLVSPDKLFISLSFDMNFVSNVLNEQREINKASNKYFNIVRKIQNLFGVV